MALMLVAGSVTSARATRCGGDCDYAGTVGIAELITGVNIALGAADSSACRAMDAAGDGTVSIGELVTAVNNALNGCPVPVASFEIVAELPGGVESAVHAVSADGTTIVGEVENGGHQRAFRWQRESGLELLMLADGHDYSSAWDVSADGTTIVGQSHHVMSLGNAAFRWTPATGTVLLPMLHEDDNDIAVFGISADGSLAVGWSNASPTRAVIWDEAGVPRALGGVDSTLAYAITADGRVVAGTQVSPQPFPGRSQPFRWEETTGLIGLGDIEGGLNNAAASAISDDGRVICGEAAFAGFHNYGATYCWRQETGMVRLPNPPEMYSDSDDGMGVSADGSVVVGGNQFFDFLRTPNTVAVRWDESGVHAVADQLRELGVDLGTWHLEYSSDVTPDGQTIVGGAISPEGERAAWIAVLPTRLAR